MRRRRAQRCVLRASAALDANVPDIAEQVLEEARALDPQHPALEEVAGRLALASHSVPAKRRLLTRNPASAVALLLLVLLALWAAVSKEAAPVHAALKWVSAAVGP